MRGLGSLVLNYRMKIDFGCLLGGLEAVTTGEALRTMQAHDRPP